MVVYTYFVGEDGFVFEEILDPVHQCIDVFWCWEFGGAFVFDAVFPEVFISLYFRVNMDSGKASENLPWACRHHRTLGMWGKKVRGERVITSGIAPLGVYRTLLQSHTACSGD